MKRRTLLGGALGCCAVPPPAAPRPASLVALFADPARASRFGQAYLDGLGRRTDAETLARAVWQDLSGAGPLRAQVAAAITRDFAAGRVVSLQGWLLAVTEARLCGLAVLA